MIYKSYEKNFAFNLNSYFRRFFFLLKNGDFFFTCIFFLILSVHVNLLKILDILGIQSLISFNSILLCKLIINFSFISIPVLLISGFVLNYLISMFEFTSILSFKLKILLKLYQINYIFVYLCQIKVCKTNIMFKYLLNIIA